MYTYYRYCVYLNGIIQNINVVKDINVSYSSLCIYIFYIYHVSISYTHYKTPHKNEIKPINTILISINSSLTSQRFTNKLITVNELINK